MTGSGGAVLVKNEVENAEVEGAETEAADAEACRLR